MLRNFKLLITGAVALLMFSNQALAGDGGAKRSSTLVVENRFDGVVGVLVDPEDDDLLELQATAAVDPAQAEEDFVEDLGGVILNDDGEAVFDVRAGSHRVFVVEAGNFENNNFDNLATDRFSVPRGDTVRVFVVEQNGQLRVVSEVDDDNNGVTP